MRRWCTREKANTCMESMRCMIYMMYNLWLQVHAWAYHLQLRLLEEVRTEKTAVKNQLLWIKLAWYPHAWAYNYIYLIIYYIHVFMLNVCCKNHASSQVLRPHTIGVSLQVPSMWAESSTEKNMIFISTSEWLLCFPWLQGHRQRPQLGGQVF